MNAPALLVLALVLAAMLGLLLHAWHERARYDNDARELRGVRVLALLVLVLLVLGLAGCGREARPNVPKQVTVVVERFKPLPAWATTPLAKPEPVDGTVGARARSHEARGGVIDVANCDRRLLARLDAGEAVDPRECGHDAGGAR